jgi:hypothetical protein
MFTPSMTWPQKENGTLASTEAWAQPLLATAVSRNKTDGWSAPLNDKRDKEVRASSCRAIAFGLHLVFFPFGKRLPFTVPYRFTVDAV